jgi:2-oxoisovalerate dehydrogenase E1 component
MGPMAEISALISEHCFEELDAPVIRCGSLDMPIPFNKALEDEFLKRNVLRKKIKSILDY